MMTSLESITLKASILEKKVSKKSLMISRMILRWYHETLISSHETFIGNIFLYMHCSDWNIWGHH